MIVVIFIAKEPILKNFKSQHFCLARALLIDGCRLFRTALIMNVLRIMQSLLWGLWPSRKTDFSGSLGTFRTCLKNLLPEGMMGLRQVMRSSWPALARESLPGTQEAFLSNSRFWDHDRHNVFIRLFFHTQIISKLSASLEKL